MAGMIPVGALWRGKKQGGASATGRINLPKGVELTIGDGQRLVLLTNDKRGNDSAPDWRLFLADDDQNESAPSSNDNGAL